jgi:multidrug efflux pump subunit AcrB
LEICLQRRNFSVLEVASATSQRNAMCNSQHLTRFRAWRRGSTRRAAALEAGFTRFRPVLMTALAMIIGMVPMAFALGEGSVGGLTVATVATLFFVPTVFGVLHRRHKLRLA